MNAGKLIDSDEDVKETEIKILLVGDLGVGKTSLIKRFLENNFSIQYIPTKGVEFYVKKTEIEKKKIVMKFWDISGDSLTNNMIETYLHHSKAIIFVYDVSNSNSLTDVREWVNTINQILITKKVKEKPYYGLVANKIDLFHIKASNLPTSESFVTENNMKTFMVSAKTGEQVSFSLTKVACEVLKIPFREEEHIQSKVFLKPVIPSDDEKYSRCKNTLQPNIHPPKNTIFKEDSPSKNTTPKVTSNLMSSNVPNNNNKVASQPPQIKPVNKVDPPKKEEQKKSSACIMF